MNKTKEAVPPLDVRLERRVVHRPEFIISAMGDMVFDGDEWYDEMLENLLAQEAAEEQQT